MAKPVINTTTSVLGYDQYEEWSYQPAASNFPTAWTSSPLPPGLSLDPDTGRIYGALEVRGTSIVYLYASNTDGMSEPLELVIGIEPASATLRLPGYEASLDIGSRILTVGDVVASIDSETPPEIVVKYRDDLLLFLRTKKNGQILDLGEAAATMSFKVLADDEKPMPVPTTAKRYGTGIGTYYAIQAKLDSLEVFEAASERVVGKDAFFDAISEIELIINNPLHVDGIGGAKLRISSRSFLTRISLDGAQQTEPA